MIINGPTGLIPVRMIFNYWDCPDTRSDFKAESLDQLKRALNSDATEHSPQQYVVFDESGTYTVWRVFEDEI